MGICLLFNCGSDPAPDNLTTTVIVGDADNNQNPPPEKIMGKKEDNNSLENQFKYLTKKSLMEINERNTKNTIRDTNKSKINLEESYSREIIYEEEGIIIF